MTSLPNSFFVAFLLVVLAASQHHHLKTTRTGRVFATVLYLHAASLVCIGLRWGWGLLGLLPIAAILSVVCAVLLYLAFRSLGRPGPAVSFSRDRWHLIPIAITIGCALLSQHQFMELVLGGTKALYAALLIKLAQSAPHSLQLVRLGWFQHTKRALWASAALILFSIVIDVFITLDFMLYDGRHAEHLVGSVNLLALLFLGWATARAGRGRAREETNSQASMPVEPEPAASTDMTDADSDYQADLALLEKLNSLLLTDNLFADPELNLQRLARKAGVPARSVSRVINAYTQLNLSQWINNVRIDHACQLLQDNSMTIGQAMEAAGFLTKSNFNREFKRLKGSSPSEWRKNKT